MILALSMLKLKFLKRILEIPSACKRPKAFIQIPNNPNRLLEYHCQSGITQVEFHDNYKA